MTKTKSHEVPKGFLLMDVVRLSNVHELGFAYHESLNRWIMIPYYGRQEKRRMGEPLIVSSDCDGERLADALERFVDGDYPVYREIVARWRDEEDADHARRAASERVRPKRGRTKPRPTSGKSGLPTMKDFNLYDSD